MSDTFTPPPVTAHEGPVPFVPPSVSSHEGSSEQPAYYRLGKGMASGAGVPMDRLEEAGKLAAKGSKKEAAGIILNTLYSTVMESPAVLMTNPATSSTAIIKNAKDSFNRAAVAYNQGDYAGAVAHAISVFPPTASAGGVFDDLKKGDIAGAMGRFIGNASVDLAAGEASGFSPTVRTKAANAISTPGVPNMVGGAALAVGGVGSLLEGHIYGAPSSAYGVKMLGKGIAEYRKHLADMTPATRSVPNAGMPSPLSYTRAPEVGGPPSPRSVSLPNQVEPGVPQPRSVSMPNQADPATPRPRSVSLPDQGPPTVEAPPQPSSAGGSYLRSRRGRESEPATGGGPSPEDLLKDDIAKGYGYKNYASAPNKAAIDSAARGVQAQGLGVSPQTQAVPQVTAPPAPTPAPTQVPATGSMRIPEVDAPEGPTAEPGDWDATLPRKNMSPAAAEAAMSNRQNLVHKAADWYKQQDTKIPASEIDLMNPKQKAEWASGVIDSSGARTSNRGYTPSSATIDMLLDRYREAE